MRNSSILKKYYNKPGDTVCTRFPPEPNGYLHIGHSKAIFINFEFAKKHSGKCYLRFDDTNPSQEKEQYTESIINDLIWLGYMPDNITYTSDYFNNLYNLAKELIKKDKAYVCQLTAKEFSICRDNMTESPYRNRDRNESLTLFENMREGRFDQGSVCLRLKCDMRSANPAMRDPVAYRIIYIPHARSGDSWCIYPTYDFSHCIVDSLEGITHSLCSSEFQTRNILYHWILDQLSDNLPHHPEQIEYSRLNIKNTILSKRKLIKLVNEKKVSGWDDPRMPTLCGLRNRGFSPQIIKNFCEKVGLNIGGSGAIIDSHILIQCARDILFKTAPRIMAVLNPLKVIIHGFSEININYSHIMNDESHEITVSPTIYIERSDFRIEDVSDPIHKKYYRLAPNKIVRLKHLFPVKCISYSFDTNGNICEVHVIPMKDYRGKIKGNIHWVSNPVKVNVISFENVFVNFKKYRIIVPEKTVNEAFVDPYIVNAKFGNYYQFERLGYYYVNSQKDIISIVSLRNTVKSI